MLPGVDVRGDGGVATAPPSRHISGNIYRWLEGQSPDIYPLADPPAWLLALLTQTIRRSFSPGHEPTKRRGFSACAYSFIRNGADVGSRDACLFILAKHCRQAGLSEEEALYFLNKANLKCRPPMSPDQAQVKIASAYSGGGHGYRCLGCEETFWKKYCSRSDCPVAKSHGM